MVEQTIQQVIDKVFLISRSVELLQKEVEQLTQENRELINELSGMKLRLDWQEGEIDKLNTKECACIDTLKKEC